MPARFRLDLIALALILAALFSGCGKSDSASSPSAPGDAGASTAITGADAEAASAAMAEINKLWVKHSDGYITARATGSPLAPERFLREVRDITVSGVQPDTLTDSDKLNGITWSGQVSFKPTVVREAGDPGVVLDGMSNNNYQRSRGQWSQWDDYPPDPIRLQKQKGAWQVVADTWLLRGTLPGPQDFANAGVN
jgi:hypothetical protein